jgi:2-polyprenyl-3-methyl-5-hydroxy-6-metoxy-1,4-benzoquinol methylase
MLADHLRYWRDYYASLHPAAATWLDYSNERVQVQTLAGAIDAAGEIAGRACLDVGCGKGQLVGILEALGASMVTGVDLVEQAITPLRSRYPRMQWVVGDAGSPATYVGLAPVDLVFAIEVLQYCPLVETLNHLWLLLRPGGRLVFTLPNRDCPIVAKPVERFAGYFLPPSVAEVQAALASLPGAETWGMRAMAFVEDQRLAPYQHTPWTTVPDWTPPPNRVQGVAVKRA